MLSVADAMVSPDAGSVHSIIHMSAVMSFAVYLFISYASTQHLTILGSALIYCILSFRNRKLILFYDLFLFCEDEEPACKIVADTHDDV